VPNIHAYQIYYDEATRAQLDPGFIPLDNQANERPDWREYWPIRKFLLGQTLQEGDYYAFLSPKFKLKTGLSAAQVREFISRQGDGADVVIFSPFYDLSALFRNVFELGDLFHPGLMSATRDWLERIGWKIDIQNMITDSSNTSFSNYFAAKPPFWKKWLELNEKLFQIAERPPVSDDLAQRLNTVHGAYPAHLKVFVMERMATLLLAAGAEFSARAHSPFLLSSSSTQFRNLMEESVVSDALKIAWAQRKDPTYLNTFNSLRGRIGEKLNSNKK
jgi:hypothetical protein